MVAVTETVFACARASAGLVSIYPRPKADGGARAAGVRGSVPAATLAVPVPEPPCGGRSKEAGEKKKKGPASNNRRSIGEATAGNSPPNYGYGQTCAFHHGLSFFGGDELLLLSPLRIDAYVQAEDLN